MLMLFVEAFPEDAEETASVEDTAALSRVSMSWEEVSSASASVCSLFFSSSASETEFSGFA